MSRIDVTETQVLTALYERLAGELGLPENRLYFTTEPESPPLLARSGDYAVSICPGDSQFVPDNQAIGNVTEEAFVTLTYYTRIQLDHPDDAKELIFALKRGLAPIKHKILKALVGHDLALPDESTFLRQLLYFTRSTGPKYSKENAIGFQSMNLAVDYDIDLESE